MASTDVAQRFREETSSSSSNSNSNSCSNNNLPMRKRSNLRLQLPSRNFDLSQQQENHFNSLLYPIFNEISEIIPSSLYLSGCGPVDDERLETLGITAVVCALSEHEERRLMNDRLKSDCHNSSSIKQQLRIRYVRLMDTACSDISVYFDQVGEFIREEIQQRGGRVLVHCAAGISRSPTLVLAYLIGYHSGGDYDLRTAYQLVKSRRRVVRPNNGFFEKLIDYERSRRSISDSSVKMIVCEEDGRIIPDVVYADEQQRTQLLRMRQ